MSGTTSENDRRQHWDAVYARRSSTEVSWFQAHPAQSLRAIEAAGLDVQAAIIDIGGGASTLIDELVQRGFEDLTVLDISANVLAKVAERLGAAASRVQLIQADVTRFRPARTYSLWHDRAVFHFLTRPDEREAYRLALRTGTAPGSHVVIATFGPQGPTRCSGLDTSRYDAPALARELGEEFQLIDSLVDVHTTPGGVQQQFLHTRFRRA